MEEHLVSYSQFSSHRVVSDISIEPEFRLPIMATYLLTAVGFFAWGQSAEALSPWPVPVVVGLGLINLGVQLGTTGVVSYVVDCHREKAGEAFAAMNFVKYVIWHNPSTSNPKWTRPNTDWKIETCLLLDL